MTDVEEEVIVMTETGARGDPAVRKLVRIYLDVMSLVSFVPEHGGFSFEFGQNMNIKTGTTNPPSKQKKFFLLHFNTTC